MSLLNRDVVPPARVVLDRPVLLTARAAYPGPANPFERENFAVPLLLVLHTRSLEALTGAERECAEVVVSMGYSPFADVWLTWGEHQFGDGASHAILGANLRGADVAALPVAVVHPAGGRLRTALDGWWQWPRLADSLYGGGEVSDAVLDAYAGALLTRVTDRHLFVTADPRILGERGRQPWMNVNIVTVQEAAALAALLMRQRGRCDLFYDETGPFETSDATRFYLQLADVLATPVQDFGEAIAVAHQTSEATYDLLFSAQDRINDLLVGRDEVRVASLLPHGGGMLTAVLYHLRAAVQTAAALLDSVAVLACEHLQIQADPLTVTFRRSEFRKAVVEAGGSELASVVGGQRYLALSFFVNALRGAVGHGGGLHGVTDPAAEVVVSHVRISTEQADKLKQACGQRRESPEVWGVQGGEWPSLDADPFCDQLVRTVIEAFDETIRALTADIRRLHPGDSPLIEAWREGNARAMQARAAMPADQRTELERRETEQQQADLDYEHSTLTRLMLYAGLSGWGLLLRLIARRTERFPSPTAPPT